ncbi:hypothetical protein JW711_02355 [Candidatus Woesearchaeota archaeon]|nr:hypothetical protein [Candidatus Woesearchaeota archaeon]
MKKSLLDKIFILALFGVIFVVISKNVSVTGNSIALPDLLPPEEHFVEEIINAADDAKQVFLPFKGPMNVNINDLGLGSIVYFKDEDNTYGITVIHIYQNYDLGLEYVNILVSPGSQRIRLQEGEEYVLDLNKDGADDAVLKVRGIQRGAVSINLRSP